MERILLIGRLFLVFWVITVGGVSAQEEISPDDREALEQLERTVGQLTDFAKRTLLNADYVPGMATVLYGSDLEDRGIRSAGEALNLVPGMNLSHTSQIYWKTVARGVPRPFAAGHVKILLNNMPLTTTFGIDLIPNLPIEQVDRIEIVRGPGSAIHGEHAVTGVMNIVTREKGRRLNGAVGSFDTLQGGGLLSLDSPNTGFKMSLNISGAKSEGADVNVGQGHFGSVYSDFFSLMTDDGANDNRKSRSGLFSMTWRGASLSAHYLESDRDRFYQTRQTGVRVHQSISLTPSLLADAELSFLKREFESDPDAAYPSAWGDDPEGWVYGFNYHEKRLHVDLDVIWSIEARHRLLFGYSFTRSELSDVLQEDNPDERFPGDVRRINSLRLQEEWRPFDRITLIGGIRYDDYNDIGEEFSPRIAAVFRLNKQRGAIRRHILKAQYGRAFQPPTFLETRVNGSVASVDFESIDTYEVGYITRKFDEVGRITVFYSDLDARIDRSSNGLGTYRINGFELEYARFLIPNFLKMDANLSHVRTEDSATGNRIPESADWLTNVCFTFSPATWLSLSLQFHSAFRRNTDPAFSQDDPNDTHLLDCTARLRHPEIKGLTLRGGVKNLFEEDIRFPSERREWGYGEYSGAPGDDRPGRFWWMSVTYVF